MAREEYDEEQSIHSMTTRQLRQYIADKASEAQSRLDSLNLKEASRALRDMASDITNARGKVKKSTSYMSKAEMREYAYELRQFISLDTESSFAKSIEWKENKKKYETFINKRRDSDFWSQFITEKGNVSKKGYQTYKDYVNFVKSVKDIWNQYGYEQIQKYGIEVVEDDALNADDVKELLEETFIFAQGKGFSQSKLIEEFEKRLSVLKSQSKAREEFRRNMAKKAKKKPGTVKPKSSGKKSKSNIKTKAPKGMKGEKVRESLN